MTAETATPLRDLPTPVASRWQPLRLGLVDLFYYDDEQFWFHDGRLLLRGNNGTGKSKVLALTLPFLLDGSLSPRRVEPDADPKKRMDWNLLLGGAHPNSERTGYTWLEFGRVDDDGTERYLTLACGLKAAAGRGIVKHWFLVTRRRIGDLRLIDATGTVLSMERLRDVVEPDRSGVVYTSAEQYRRAVDEALFELGEERYAALVDLLVHLRQPQLSKRPDERALSNALTEALAPLDQAIVSDVAESFRSLDEDRRGLEETRDTLLSAETFLRHYVGYARVATRRTTRHVREANSAYEWAGRNLNETQAELATLESEIAALDRREEAVERRGHELRARDVALREGPAAREARELQRAEDEAAAAERRAGDSDSEARAAAERAEEARWEATDRTGALDHERRRADEARTVAATAAAPAGLAADHESLVADAAAAERALERRRGQLALVRRLADDASALDAKAGALRSRLDDAEAEQARRAAEATECEDAVEAGARDYRDSVAAYVGGLMELRLLDADALPAASAGWARTMTGEGPLEAAVRACVSERLDEIARRRATAEQAMATVADERQHALARRAELESGQDPEPGPWPGRDSTVRAGTTGAPLWRVTDFAGSLPAPQRAAVEAALEASGLLDAWIRPDGSVTDVVAGDVVLGADGAPARSSLADVLVAAPDDDSLPPGIVVQVLARIGFGEQSGAAVWIGADGAWGAGPVRGSAAKEAAEYVGAGARQTTRRRLVAELSARIETLDREIATATAHIAEADVERGRVHADEAAQPSVEDLVRRHERASRAVQELNRAREAVAGIRNDWEWAAGEARQVHDELEETARTLRTPTTHDELQAATDAVTEYAHALATARLRGEHQRDAAEQADRASSRAQAAQDEASAAAERAHRETMAAAASRARADELHATVGASVAELQSQLAGVAASLEGLSAERSALAEQRSVAEGRRGALGEKLQHLTEHRDETSAERDGAVARLRDLTATGLVRVALPDLATPDPAAPAEWTITAALAAARAAEAELEGTDDSDESWQRVRQRVSNAQTELQSAMSRHGHEAHAQMYDEVILARVRYRGEDLDIDLLAARLAADVAQREQLLSAREREIIENYLVNDVAGHLSELMARAEAQIAEMNLELAQRRTSTGMQLRVLWKERADGPAGLKEARALMVRSDLSWSGTDRQAIGDFLQARIREEREVDPAASWLEHLGRALDYRQWHTFVVERRQHDVWRPASGPASGGERALAASIPLFAAASSHYNSAGPHAPRLILLDEAFAGVDDDSRAKSLGLLATFDLDVVMTSEREWGCYPEVPGLAIAQLSRREGIDAVGVTRWRWDGRRRERDVEPADAARAGVGAVVGGEGGLARSLFEAG
jgi:uncharacterized protein (TIGR02680 family)